MVSNRLLYLYCEPGDDVRDFQDGVNAIRNLPGQSSAFDPLAVDGIFGSKSLKRAQEFQRLNGLLVDGLVGNGTWGTLLELLHGKGGHIPADRPPGGTGDTQQTKGTQSFGKPLPAKPVGKPPPGTTGSKTQETKTFGQVGQTGTQGMKSEHDPFGQKTAPGSQKVSWWGL